MNSETATAHRLSRGSDFVSAGMLAAIGLCLALQAWLIFFRQFNWDEYFYLSQVHDYLRGDLSGAMQTAHVHLFAWLAHVGDEHDQLIVGRLVMLGCQAVSCWSLYLIARAWTGRAPALVATLAYASAGMTLLYGASFRTDPLAEALCLGALAIFARAGWKSRTMLLVAALLAVAALVTIKVVFYAPAFLAVGVWRILASDRPSAMFSSAILCTALTLLCFAVFYGVHQASLAHASIAQTEALVRRAAGKTLGGAGLFPRLFEIRVAALRAPVQTVLIALAVPFLLLEVFNPRRRWQAVAVLGCVGPLLCLIFYRNAFPYFFPFITAPACVAIAWLIEERRWNARMFATLAIAMMVLGIAFTYAARGTGQGTQRQVIAAVHEIFPDPVAVIDRNHMVATYPKHGFFMSTWGLEDYRTRGPFVEEALAREPVPLLLLNSPSLEQAVGSALTMPLTYLLLEADRKALSENFIPHWGPIWVAGKRLHPAASGSAFHISIPGLYTLEGEDLVVDGSRVPSGGVLRLARGEHRMAAASQSLRLLRWGDHLRRPAQPPPAEPIFQGF